MEIESQPEPIPLGDVKELLEKELSIRENRLRCIECGNFQAVPEIEPVVENLLKTTTKNLKRQWVQLVILVVRRD